MKERKELKLDVEQLEERIAPIAPGLQGYEGQPGNQGGGGNNNPVPNGATPQPKG
jgi:hypothetical protein